MNPASFCRAASPATHASNEPAGRAAPAHPVDRGEELVGCGQLSARPEDTLDDFRHGLDLMGELGAGLPSDGPRPTRPA